MSGLIRATDHELALVLTVLTGSAQTVGQLSLASGVPERLVQSAIERLRGESRALISSGGRGYWLPVTLEEAEHNARVRQGRIRTQARTIAGEMRLIRRLRAPLTLGLEAA